MGIPLPSSKIPIQAAVRRFTKGHEQHPIHRHAIHGNRDTRDALRLGRVGERGGDRASKIRGRGDRVRFLSECPGDAGRGSRGGFFDARRGALEGGDRKTPPPSRGAGSRGDCHGYVGGNRGRGSGQSDPDGARDTTHDEPRGHTPARRGNTRARDFTLPLRRHRGGIPRRHR
ncbi:MAG: hypothetical protein RLZZ505_3350 [Verrucomicrobiota bacterium]